MRVAMSSETENTILFSTAPIKPIGISGNDSGNYTYDGNLKRVKEVVGGQTIYSVYSRLGALCSCATMRAMGKKTDYLNVSGQTFVRNANGVPAYPLNDALGTAYMVADPTVASLPLITTLPSVSL